MALCALLRPGGQNVNKLATAAQLRFDAGGSASLPAEVKKRLARLAGSRMTAAGVLVIEARRHRTQRANREDALERLVALIRKAVRHPRKARSDQAHGVEPAAPAGRQEAPQPDQASARQTARAAMTVCPQMGA